MILLALIVTSYAGCGNPERKKTKLYHRGLIYARRGRCTEAISEFQKALQIDPNLALAHYEMGVCYSKLHYHDQAIKALEVARSLDSGLAVKSLSQIAAVYSDMDNIPAARQSFIEALSLDLDNTEALFSLGRLEFREKNFDEAQRRFEKVIDIDPEHVEARFMQAEIFMQKQDFDTAEAQLKKTIEIDPSYTPALLGLAKIYRFTQQYERAADILTKILIDNPDDVRARAALAEVYFAVNRHDDARREADTLLKAAPANPAAHLLLGAICVKQKDYEKAVIHLTMAAGSETASAHTHYLLGLALNETQHSAQAIAAFQRALSLEPDNVPSRLMLAQTHLREGAFEAAGREIGYVLSKEPENEFARHLWVRVQAIRQTFEYIDSLLASEGVSEKNAEKIKAALRAFHANDLSTTQSICQELLADESGSAMPLNLIGLVSLKQDRLDEALRYFHEASVLNPAFGASYVNMANVYMALGNPAEAVQNYRKALDLYPDDNALRLRFVKALTLMNLYDEAELFLKKQIQETPDQFSYRLALAELFLSTARYQDCRNELTTILRRNPDNQNALRLFAESFAKEGTFDKAVTNFEKLLKLRPDSEYVKTRLALCNLSLGRLEKAEQFLAKESTQDNMLRDLAVSLVLQKKGDYEGAEKALSRLQQEKHDALSFGLMLASLQAAQAKDITSSMPTSEGFKESWLRFLRGNSFDESELYEFNLTIALTQARWHLPSLATLDRLARMKGPNPALAELIGGLYEKEGRYEEATYWYNSALATDPSYWPAHNRLGVLSLRSGELSEAERHFVAASKQQPESLVILFNLGRVYLLEGNDEAALATYLKINQTYPNLAPVLNNIAWLLAKDQDRLEQALEYAKLAASSQPLSPDVRDTLGWIFFQKGDYETAKQHLDAAVLSDSLNPSIRYHRGMAYYKLGETEKALEEFKAAASAPSPFPEQELNARMVKELS
ncbi:MAG: tetratricopeptide repeat protein [Candidatus Abyssubacteria bacterium]